MWVRREREKELASILSGSDLSGLVVVAVVVGLLWLVGFYCHLFRWCCVCFAHVLRGLYEKYTLDTVLGRGVGGHMTLCISRAGVG